MPSQVPYRSFPDLPQRASNQLFRNFEALTSFINGKSGLPILVAASNAPSAERTAAAFKCSGTDDATVINQALAVVQATPGGVLQLSAGTFNLGTTQISSLTACTLRGRGMGVTTIKLTSGTNGSNNLLTFNSAGSTGGVVTVPIMVEELTIDGNGINNATFAGSAIAYANGCGGTLLRNVRVTGVTTSADTIIGAIHNTQSTNGPHYFDNFNMDNCTGIRGFCPGSGGGVAFMHACHFQGNYSNATLFLAGNSAQTFLVGSWFANSNASGAVIRAATTTQQNSTITGCYVASSGGQAFVGGTTMTQCEIVGNVFVVAASASSCVALGEGDYVFADNYLNNGVVGLQVVCAGTSVKRITGNTIVGTQQDGIKVTATSSSKGLDVRENTVVNAGRQTANTFPGISLTAGATTITDTAVVNNVVRVTSGSVSVGIKVTDAGCTNTLVWGNDVNGAYGTAAFTDAGTSTRTIPDPAPPGGAPSGAASGDLAGSYPNPVVDGWRGKPLSATLPTANGQVYVYDATGGGWNPHAIGGDIGPLDNTGATTVKGLQGVPVAATAPTSSQVLTYNGTQWAPAPGGGSGILVAEASATPPSFPYTGGPNVFQVVPGSDLTITNPGVAVVVKSQGGGYLTNGATTDIIDFRVGISLDGGTTWTYGGTPSGSGNFVSPRMPVFADALAVGTPSGNIKARLEVNNRVNASGGGISTPGISVLVWTQSAGVPAGGNATSIQGVMVDSVLPADGEALIYNGGTGKWEPSIGPPVQLEVYCKAIQTTAQSIPAGAFTNITFNGADIRDTLNMHDPTTNNTQIVVPYTGIYAIVGSIWFNATAAGSLREAGIRVNGSLVWENRQTNAQNATAQPDVEVSGLQFLNAGDIVTLAALQDTGAALNTLIVAARGPFLSVALIQRVA